MAVATSHWRTWAMDSNIYHQFYASKLGSRERPNISSLQGNYLRDGLLSASITAKLTSESPVAREEFEKRGQPHGRSVPVNRSLTG